MTYYYWNVETDNVFLEEDANGDAIAEYTQEPGLYGELIAQERDGQTSYYQFDGQGSTRVLTDENEKITDTYIYTAFGEIVAKTGSTTNPFGYKGALGYYVNPDTNDVYVRERPYRPSIGRWLTVDPLLCVLASFDANVSSLLNQYAYVGNNPLICADPIGLARECAGCCKVKSLTVDPPKAECTFARVGEDRLVSYVAHFQVSAEFESQPPTLDCGCCSYYQEIKGVVRHRLTPGGPWVVDREVPEFVEDCTRDEFGTEQCYGHRSAPERPNDVYSGPDRMTILALEIQQRPASVPREISKRMRRA